jgi:two-component system sensor histidine kinase and response regulator WspE
MTPPSAADFDPMLLDLFKVELENHTRVLEKGLVEAEADRAPERIEPLMRAAHSIKGAARIVGLTRAVSLAHAMEDLLSAAQKGTLALTGGQVDLLLKGNDLYAAAARSEAAAIPGWIAAREGEFEAMAGEIRASLTGPPGPPPAAPAAAPQVKPTAGGAPAPEPETAAPPASPPGGAAGSGPAPRESAAAAAPPPGESRPAAPERAEKGLVRVMTEHLDRLMGLAGESLVQAQSIKAFYPALLRIKKGFPPLTSALEHLLESLDKRRDRETALRLREALDQIERICHLTTDHTVDFELSSRRLEKLAHRLYDEVVASRMQPFSDGMHGFARLVRDVAKELGKKVRLEILGEATPVDRDILEKLEAPLSHLIRNALDHGLETPKERERAGKPAEGRITVEARHVAGMLNIIVTDDGRGIPLERLRAKVVEKGLAAPELAAGLTKGELLEFLFLPGFSTAGKVTEISGRGVGLDVVFTMVQEVGGTVRVESGEGKGTRFLLLLPLTLSVIRTLLIEIDAETYAMPLTRIDRILRVPHAALGVVEDRQFYCLDGENVGIVDTRQLFRIPHSAGRADPCHLLIFSDRMSRFGLVVDRFIGQQDLVVRPLDARLGKLANISAGAILEDGSPVLILDVDDLVRSIDHLLAHGRPRKVGGVAAAPAADRTQRVLVVDDSLTVRAVERKLLETAGYEVVVAVDGVDGWNSLQGGAFDLVVTDVDMPRMNGIELVRKIKADPLLKELPVMIVSYKDREEDRLRGLEAGANYYLTKSSFHDETLLTAVRDLIGGSGKP